MSIHERLSRLLFIVPYVVHRDGVPVGELAEKLAVAQKQLMADLDLLAMVGQPPLTPDHLIDIYVEDDIVYVELDQSLSRPLRLTHEEARALALAASVVGNLGGIRDTLRGVLNKILAHLSTHDREQIESFARRVAIDKGDNPQPSVLLRRAIEGQKQIEIDYYSASSDQKKRYHLSPVALMSHSGLDYLVALDDAQEHQEKLFRLDRMQNVVVTEHAATLPQPIDLEKFRTEKLYQGPDTTGVLVRFSASVAAQVKERFVDSDLRELSDGSVTVRLQTSSPTLLARWVLPFGTAAEVLEPIEQRQAMVEFCRAALNVYRSEQV